MGLHDTIHAAGVLSLIASVYTVTNAYFKRPGAGPVGSCPLLAAVVIGGPSRWVAQEGAASALDTPLSKTGPKGSSTGTVITTDRTS